MVELFASQALVSGELRKRSMQTLCFQSAYHAGVRAKKLLSSSYQRIEPAVGLADVTPARFWAPVYGTATGYDVAIL